MGRGDGDGRPPIEILGADLGVGSTQQVALGPRRPKPGRGRSLAIAFGVVVLLVGGLVVGGGDDTKSAAPEEERDNQERIHLDKPQTSTTARGSTSTRPTTTTTVPTGPPFGEPFDGALLIYAGTWSRVDLTTGSSTPLGIPLSNFYEAVVVAGGIVLPSGDEEVWYIPVLDGGEEHGHIVLGPGDAALPAGRDRVWLVDDPEDGEQPAQQVAVRLVDLDGTVLRSFQVPGSAVAYATSDAVILSRGGRVYAADEDGIRPIATGWPMGTVGETVLIVGCDDGGVCTLEQHPTDGGTPRELVALEDPDRVSYEAVEASDGRVSVVEYDNYGGGYSRLLLFDASGASLLPPDVELGQLVGRPQLLPGDLGFLLVDGATIVRLHEAGGTWISDPVPRTSLSGIEGAFVVTP